MRRTTLLTCLCFMLVARAVAAAEAPFPVPVVEMSGSAEQVGTAHARQLGGPIRELFKAYFDRYFQSPAQKKLTMMAATAFRPYLAPEHRDELKAMATGVGMDEREALLAQCFLDLMPMTACSTVGLPAAAAPDGVARMGRNLDFPSFNVADKQSVVMIFRPEGRYQFASVAWPGMVGVLTGMNEHGLTLANMEVDRGQRLPVAMPYIMLYRTVLEQCRTVEEAVELLETTPRQSANNLMVMDAAGGRAVVEITPEKVTVRRAPDDQAIVSTNHQRGGDLSAPGRCPRYDRLTAASAEAFGDVSREDVQGMMGAVAMGKMTLQSMVFEPSTRVMYLAVGKNAPEKGFHRLDLKQYFGDAK
jgi:isopenicillin-N N-acyltransferase like protein